MSQSQPRSQQDEMSPNQGASESHHRYSSSTHHCRRPNSSSSLGSTTIASGGDDGGGNSSQSDGGAVSDDDGDDLHGRALYTDRILGQPAPPGSSSTSYRMSHHRHRSPARNPVKGLDDTRYGGAATHRRSGPTAAAQGFARAGDEASAWFPDYNHAYPTQPQPQPQPQLSPSAPGLYGNQQQQQRLWSRPAPRAPRGRPFFFPPPPATQSWPLHYDTPAGPRVGRYRPRGAPRPGGPVDGGGGGRGRLRRGLGAASSDPVAAAARAALARSLDRRLAGDLGLDGYEEESALFINGAWWRQQERE